MPLSPALTLVPFTEDLLASVQPWFRDPQVRHYLGGPEWPVRELRLMQIKGGEAFRGRSVLRVHSWVALDAAGEPAAKLGGDVYDRWSRYDGSRPDQPAVSAVEPGPAMGLSYVVDPERWRQGFGRAVLQAAVSHPSVRDVRLFAAGIDANNQASRRCAAAAGFTPDDDDPDWEDTVYYVLRRSASPSTHQSHARSRAVTVRGRLPDLTRRSSAGTGDLDEVPSGSRRKARTSSPQEGGAGGPRNSTPRC